MLGLIAFFVVLAQQDPLKALLLADTSRPVRRAIDAQTQFERNRRYRLPTTAGGGGRCDERIGRFCYWYEEGDTALPKEPPSIHQARARLLETLASVSRASPGSAWVVGQRVRYLVEHREPDSALGVAKSCAAVAWWCSALSGFVLHAAARFDQADSAFSRAIAAMPEEVRCFWSDWTMVLDGRVASDYDRLDCEKRIARADTLFLLAQPLLTRPGNDLRTEFLSRRVMAALSAVATSPYQIGWGRDLEEMMIRYGWSTAWSVAERPVASLDQPSVIGHQRSPAYRFWPVPDREQPEAWSWDLKPDRPRSRYAPVYADRITPAQGYQIARFPRGDSTIVVAAMAVEHDTAFRARPVDLALAASGPGLPTAIDRRDSTVNEPRLLRLAGSALVVSIEASPSHGRVFLVGRSHFPPPPPSPGDGIVVSDPLLFRPTTELPETVESAARTALSSLATKRSEPVGVYWEVGQSAPDSVAIAVSVEPLRRGVLGRLGEGLSLVKRRSSLTLQWRAKSDGPGVVGRAFELDLSRLPAGRYRLRLTATVAGRTAATERTIALDP